ncbi:S-type pyocin domain-containing protein [Vibrio sp. ZSDZ65]|uniref:S-type pyocin domain-containing protein n=1 Tax=Vibrio qingdaonensis TaxID=2829491 RepID=A0A9X3CMG5_9VIBR|nr:S-type pyocin domain-containing protein [Vibrio qingdaonensis]MCW8346083.1 S-type pyocin domain-containing protein [Vibrio qingdaonensis]
MGYKTVELIHLMTHEFLQVEGDFESLSERELKDVIPSGMGYRQFIEQLKQGHLLLLNDSPRAPLLMKDNNALSSATWGLNTHVSNNIEPAAQKALLVRTQMSGGTSSGTQSKSLHPPLPMPTYIPERPRPDDSDEPPTLKYEYNIDIACSHDAFHRNVGCSFALAKTKKEAMLGRWNESKIEEGTRYTLLTAFDEPKKLVGQVASISMGISPNQPVKMRTIGSSVALEGFIPVTPAVQLGERLGYPTEGFYYHIHDGKLIQEYRILGDKKWSFYATRSMHHRLDSERGYNIDQTAILVFWKLKGKVVENQHLIYLDRQITRGELDSLNDEWLDEHGVSLDIPELLTATKKAIQTRNDFMATKEETQPLPHHIVQTDPETGQRETWMSIAQKYALTPKTLLTLNPQYDADPMSLAVGHSLNVTQNAEGPKAKPSFFASPPAKPEKVNQPSNTYYEFSESYLADTHVKAINHEHLIEKDIPIVNLKEVTPSKVFAKSCQLPQGCIDAGVIEEPIQNFGPWSFFFGQAQAHPLVIPAIQATQAQIAMGATAFMAGQPKTSASDSTATELEKLAGTLKDKLVESYRWKVDGISALFAMQQSLLGDGTQYSDKELRQLSTVQSRLRVHITEPNEGEYYPNVKAYHVDDTRIPVKYVAQDDNNQLSVQLENEGPIIYWTPADSGDPNWQSTPSQDDGFELEDIRVTPIHSDETTVTVTPMPEEKDWRDAILVFPESSGITPLYIVYSENAYSSGFKTFLSPDSYPGVSRARHFQEANENLLKMIESDQGFASQMESLNIKLERTATGLAPRRPPKGWTWHHEREKGSMVLVPREQHTIGSDEWGVLHPENKGGYSIWGK